MTCFKYLLYMNCRNENWTSISVWNKEQVLGNGVLINGSLCEPVKRKKEDTWCTIMSDGWIRPTKLSIINFIVYSKGTTMFLKLVDASNYIKDHKYIYDLLKTVIKEVGKEMWSKLSQIIGRRSWKQGNNWWRSITYIRLRVRRTALT